MDIQKITKNIKSGAGKIIDAFLENAAGARYALRLPLTENFKNSSSVLTAWVFSLKEVEKYFDLMQYVDSTSKTSLYEMIKDGANEEDIKKILKTDGFINHKNNIYKNDEEPPSEKEILETFKELVTPGRVLELAIAPFKNEGLITLCKHNKNLIDHENLKSNIFSQHKHNFDKGLELFGNLRFPEGVDATKIAEFMATDETFGTFLDDFYGRNLEHFGKTTLPWAINSLVYHAPNEEKQAICTAIKKNPILSSALDIGYQMAEEEMGKNIPSTLEY